MPQLEFKTWLFFLIINWTTLLLIFLLFKNYNNNQTIKKENIPKEKNNSIKWKWN